MTEDTRDTQKSTEEAILHGWIEPHNNRIVSFIIISTPSDDDFRLLPQEQNLLQADLEYIDALFGSVKVLANQIGLSVSRETFDKCWEEILLMTHSRNQLIALMEGDLEKGPLH